MNETFLVEPPLETVIPARNADAFRDQRSELAQEIVAHAPVGIEKWALVIFLLIIAIFIFIAWLVKYPDIIEARAVLNAADAPREIMPRQDGRLVRIFVRNDEAVEQNAVIGWIESTANHQRVLSLLHELNTGFALLERGNIGGLRGKFDRYFSDLGDVQPAYQEFIGAWQQFSDYVINGFQTKRKIKLQEDIANLGQIGASLRNQIDLSHQDRSLAETTFNMNHRLFQERVLSAEDYRREQSKYVSKKMAALQMESTLLNGEMQERDRRKELEQLEHDIAQQTMIFKQALQSLKSNVEGWKMRYVLEAPMKGRVIFTLPLQEKQVIRSGRILGYVVPEAVTYYAETSLPQQNFGKIRSGQQVQVRFDAYPYQELGFVEGELDYISNVPTDSSGFFATIRFKNGLVTNSGKQLEYRNGLKAQAVIITKEMRLIERFYYNLVKYTSTGSK